MLKYLLNTLSPTPIPDKFKYVNSATSGEANKYGIVGEWLDDGLAWIGDKLLDVLEPFCNWGIRIIILSCFVIWYCSGERKYIAAGIKWTILFTLFWTIRSAIG